MAQKAENYRATGDVVYAWPAASTAINSGDLVQLNPATGTIIPLALTQDGAHRYCGVCDENWNATDATRRYGAGTTAYTAPSTTTGVQMLMVHTKGMYDLAISDTSGTCGETVYLSTATSGAQVFTVTQPNTSSTTVPIGVLGEDFSGATANDVQKVIIFTQFDNANNAILDYLKNHVVSGMHIGWDASSHISFNKGVTFVDGVAYSHIAGVNTLVTLCAAQANHQRVVLYVVNSAGAIQCVDPGTYLFLSTVGGTATALQDSAYWPSTSFMIFGAGFLGSNSTDLNAGATKNVRRNVIDIMFRRFIN